MTNVKSRVLADGFLPPYRTRARNIASASENRIHDDEVARRYGFSGGLVPGIVVYAYLTRPVVEGLGADWLARGSARVRFLAPCYEGEEVVVRAAASSDEGERIELTAARADGTSCAQGEAIVSVLAASRSAVFDHPRLPLPAERPPASASVLEPGTALGTLELRLDPNVGERFAESIGDDLALYRGGGGIAHPALLLGLANEVLVRNVVLGPWIHAASEVEHLSLARYGDRLSVRARVVDRFDRKGHEFVVLDVLVSAEPDRPIQRVRHTAIYRPRPVAGS